MAERSDTFLVARVLDLAEVRSFYCQMPLFFPEPVKVDVRGFAAFDFSNPVPVKNDSGGIIGFACLDWEQGELRPRAQLFLIRETPERMDLENNLRPCFLVVGEHFNIYGAVNHPTAADAKPRSICIDSLRLTSTLGSYW